MSSKPFIDEFKANCIFRLKESNRMLWRCLDDYDEKSIWEKPNNHTNSVANLLLHLDGNMSQYIISSLAGNPDKRQREKEFSRKRGYKKGDLITKFKKTLDEVEDIIEKIDDSELMRERIVQGFRLSGIGIIIHVVEHYSYHVGQIALLTKIRTDKDLGFYSGIDLNKLNPQ